MYGPPSVAGGIRPPAHPIGAEGAEAQTVDALPAPRCGCLPPGPRGVSDGGGQVAQGERGAGDGRGVEAAVGVEEKEAGGERITIVMRNIAGHANYKEERVRADSSEEEQVRENYAARGWKLEDRSVDRDAPSDFVRLGFRKTE